MYKCFIIIWFQNLIDNKRWIHRTSEEIRAIRWESHRIPAASSQDFRHRRRDLPTAGGVPPRLHQGPGGGAGGGGGLHVRGGGRADRHHRHSPHRLENPNRQLWGAQHHPLPLGHGHQPLQTQAQYPELQPRRHGLRRRNNRRGSRRWPVESVSGVVCVDSEHGSS